MRLTSPSGSGRPMSRQELAEAANAYLWERHQRRASLDGNYIGKLERGDHRWPQPIYREALRAVLGATADADIGFYVMRAHPHHTRDASLGVGGAPARVVRQEDQHPPRQTTADLVNALLTPAISGDAEPATADALTRLATRAWRLRQAAQYAALSQLLPSLLIQAETSKGSLSGTDEERAVRVLAHTYNAASSLLRRVGDEQLALVAADRAVRAASTLDDPVLVAAARYRLANVLLSGNRVDAAKTVALHAADLTSPSRSHTPRSVAVWGGLLLTAAVAAARAQAESQAWELMGEAKAGARILGTDHADIYAIFGPTNLAIHGVQVAVELGDGRDAVRRSHAVHVARLPASLRERRSQFLTDVAHGHVLTNNDAEAIAALLEAERVAPEEIRLSGQVRSMTETMLSRERTGAVPELRRLAATIGLTR